MRRDSVITRNKNLECKDKHDGKSKHAVFCE